MARARRELREAVGDDAAEEILAELRLIIADAERDPWLREALLRAMEASG